MPFARTVMFGWWEVITFNPPVIEGSTVSERLGNGVSRRRWSRLGRGGEKSSKGLVLFLSGRLEHV